MIHVYRARTGVLVICDAAPLGEDNIVTAFIATYARWIRRARGQGKESS